MNLFCKFDEYLSELKQGFSRNKTVWIILLTVIIVGLVLGIVLVAKADYNEWYFNRYANASKLVNGGGSTFFRLLFQTVLLVLVCIISLLDVWTYFICYVFALILSVLYGGTVCILVGEFSAIGVLYAFCVITFVAEFFLMFFIALGNCRIVRTFGQACCDAKTVIFTGNLTFLTKTVLLFVIIRPITELI